MRLIPVTTFTVGIFFIVACSVSKNASAPVATAPAPPVAVTPPPSPVAAAKSVTGIYEPGQEELTAIQGKHPGATMQSLTEGYKLYTTACTKCHPAKSIYQYPEQSWKGIVDDMAYKAYLFQAQKEAVYQYVMAIKATQPSGVR